MGGIASNGNKGSRAWRRLIAAATGEHAVAGIGSEQQQLAAAAAAAAATNAAGDSRPHPPAGLMAPIAASGCI
jgi:sugar (pentulose or hexulose) kinase